MNFEGASPRACIVLIVNIIGNNFIRVIIIIIAIIIPNKHKMLYT